jgi:hemerythrin-like domain-containing protein
MSTRRNIQPERPRRDARTAAPHLAGAELMDRTHREMLQALIRMNELANLLATPAQDAAATALAAPLCSFFNGPARKHHEAEETTLFPALLASGSAELRGHVQRLQQDHRWLEEDWLELEPHLQAVASGYCDAHRDFLQPALREYAGLCHEHMEFEESLMHPEAQRGLVTATPHR